MRLVPLLLCLCLLPTPVRVVRDTIAMGTTLHADVAAPTREQGLRASESVLAAVDSVDRLLSTWHPSALDSLNHAPVGREVSPAPRLSRVLGEVLAWRDSVGAAFDPVTGALTDAWQLRAAGVDPSPGRLARARQAIGPQGMEFDHGATRVVRRDSLAWLDSGGFGKGAALREARAAMHRHRISSALIDFGGQLLLLSQPGDHRGWPVVIADPRDRNRPAFRLRVRNGSVATSAQSERFVTVRGHRYGHILDPRTGRPVPAWGSATVIADDPLEADILSTALFVMGPASALRWAERHPAVGVVLLVTTPRGLEARVSTGGRRYVDPS